jgi:threonine dehydrogenase-like Zn-dependent dehydrogenase
MLKDAGRVLAVDRVPSRLDMARAQGAEVIDFEHEDPVQALKYLTGGIGPDRAIDAVGVDAVTAHHGPAAKPSQLDQFAKEQKAVAPDAKPVDGHWEPGDAPTQVLRWAVQSLAKAGTLAIIGVYPESVKTFPIGAAMNKNLTINMGNCNHRKYIPKLLQMVRSGQSDPTKILTEREPLVSAIDAYKAFDERQAGWIKVMLEPAGTPAPVAAR